MPRFSTDDPVVEENQPRFGQNDPVIETPAPAVRQPGDFIGPRWRVGVGGKPFLTPEAVGAAPPVQTIGKQLGQGWQDINKPLIPLGRDTTKQETAGMGPVLKSAIGAGEASKHFTESLTSPLNIATLGGGGALMKAYPILSRALSGVFGVTMAKQAAEEAGDLAGIPKDQRDAKTVAKHLTSIALTGGTAGLAAYEAGLRKTTLVQPAANPPPPAQPGVPKRVPVTDYEARKAQAKAEFEARRKRIEAAPKPTPAFTPPPASDLLAEPQKPIGKPAPIAPVVDMDLTKPIGTVSIEPKPEGETQNASEIRSTAPVLGSEIRPRVGEKAPLRQQGEAPGAQGEVQKEPLETQGVAPPVPASQVLPAIRLVPKAAGQPAEIVTGKAGQTHPDIIRDHKLKAKDIDSRGFMGPQGWMDRETAAAATGLPTQFEAGKLHSTDLPEDSGPGEAPKVAEPGAKANPLPAPEKGPGSFSSLDEIDASKLTPAQKVKARDKFLKSKGVKPPEEPPAEGIISMGGKAHGPAKAAQAEAAKAAVSTAKLGIWPVEEWTYDALKKQSLKQRREKAQFLGMRDAAGILDTAPALLANQAAKRITELAGGAPGSAAESMGMMNPLTQPGRPSLESQLMAALEALRAQPGYQEPGDRIKAADRIAKQLAVGKGFFTDWALRIKAGSEQYKRLLFGAPTEEGPFWSPKKDWAAQRQVNAGVAREMIQKAKADYPKQLTRQGMGKYAEALMFDDPAAKLAAWATTAKPQYKAQYVAALKLTPEQIQAARQAVQYYEAKGKELQDAGLLNNLIEDYAGQHMVARPGKAPQEMNALRADLVSGKLNTNFKYAMNRVFQTEHDLEQGGYSLKTTDLFDKLANYALSAENVLADRAVVKEWMKGETEDGKPLFSTGQNTRELTSKKYAVVKEGQDRALRVFDKPEDAQQFAKANRGTVQERANPALLVNPKVRPHPVWKDAAGNEQDISGEYVRIDHPAFKKWQWAETEPDGKQVFVQGDVWAHKSIAGELKNTFGRSRLYDVPGIDTATRLNAEMKGMKLVGAFHQVKTGIHALSHLVSPWGQPEVDVHSPETYDALRAGLELFDSGQGEIFSEGLASGSWLQGIANLPAMLNENLNFGDRLRQYQEYLFQDYIPRIKMATYRAALARNVERFKKDTDINTIKQWTAIQVNSGYGELNWRLMGSNPTFRHMLQLSLLAPDFQAAQHGFMGQMFTKMGAENRMSAAIMVGAVYTGARILNQIFDNDPHFEPKNALAVRIGNRWYSIRTIPGDAMRAMTTPLNYVRARIAPVPGATIEALSKTSGMGRKETGMELLKSTLERFVPVPVSPQPGLGFVEHAMTSTFGVYDRRASNISDTQGMAADWRKAHDPSWRDEGAVQYPESQYKPLRDALADDDMATAVREYHKLVAAGHDPKKIEQTMRPGLFTSPAKAATAKPVSIQKETAFKASLSPEKRKTYEKAVKEKADIYSRFQSLDKR